MEKAISPILAVIVLTGISLIIATLVASWSGEFAKTESEKATEHAGLLCDYSTFAVDYVKLCTEEKWMEIKLEGSGTRSVSIKSVQVVTNDSTKTYLNGEDFNAPPIAPDSFVVVRIGNVSNFTEEVRIIPTECPENTLPVSKEEFILAC